ncbi:MAG TPA: hydroxymethylbilane synthase [Solirubrobacteraceae bacterium]|nr:hydroxymethylbilane synthase [Solirubrobacteraceae bacterium]
MRIGTRGSALALAQAGAVAALLGPAAELVPVTTSGDRGATGQDKERWVKELELGLLDGDLDLAVHSAKDVPTVLPDGLALVGSPARADPLDALVGAPSLAQLAPGARVGTASLRRAAQLLALRADLDVVVVHGNVDTRLRRLHDGELDALVLAAAGLRRLERAAEIGCLLRELVPAPGQGTLVLEARADDEAAAAAVAAITHMPTWDALIAERALVAALDASCNTPLGAHARVRDGAIALRTFVGLPDGSAWLRDEAPPAPAPAEAGARAAERLLAAGGGELLARAEEMATA